MSARRAPAPPRARPATAAAAPRRPSPTPIWCWAISIPSNFLGGDSRLDRAAAERAVDRLAGRARRRPGGCGRGIHRVINTNMAEGVRLVSVRRGVDPRRFALLAFGGAAGLHVTDVARQLELRRVVVPRVAAVLSAWGMLTTDLRCEIARTHIGDAGAPGRRRRQAAVRRDGDGGARRASPPGSTGRSRCSARSTCAMASRCSRSPCRSTTSTGPHADPLPEIVERFHARHEALYTYALRDQEAVLVNARAVAIGQLPEPAAGAEPGRRPRRAAGRRAADLAGRLGQRPGP